MDEINDKSLNLQFYNYICEKIGTDELIRLRRKYYLLYDFLLQMNSETIINSGSKSEGLELDGSDTDLMMLQRGITVLENETQRSNRKPNVFIMSTQDIKPGFTMLKLSKSSFIPNGSNLLHYSDIWGKHIVLSNEKAKQWLSSRWENSAFVHGPCITDKDYMHDLAFCLRCPTWIRQARKLRGKSRSWPCDRVVENTEKCGTLFVPIGFKESTTEHLEWRISFSIAEKLLIYTFSHTQMLCYALLKVMVKEIIDPYTNAKGILCSYFLKTVVLWVSEECRGNEWQPDMIIPCFMACLARLLYCVNNSYLSHYFIPEINLLEDKLISNKAFELKNLLTEFYGIGPRFFTYSKTFSKPAVIHRSSFSIINLFNTFYSSDERSIRTRGSHNVTFSCQSCYNYLFSKISKFSFKRRNPLNLNVYVCRTCQTAGNSRGNSRINLLSNKDLYKNHKQRLPYIIIGLNTDAAAGWLYLATYLFSLQHFLVSLKIVEYALSKCTPDKLYCLKNHLHYEQLDYIEQKALKYGCLDICSIYRRHVIKTVRFEENSILPFELIDDLKNRHIFTNSAFPPVVYAHYLRFLCFYRLYDGANCRESLQDIQLTIENQYFVCAYQKVISYKLLAIAHLKIGDRISAKQCLVVADQLKDFVPFCCSNAKHKNT